MDELLTRIAAGAVINFTLLTLLWALSRHLTNVGIVDAYWAAGFAVIAWTVYLTGDGASARAPVILGLVTLWALRLGVHLTLRAWGEPEDRRYAAMRARAGPSFVLKSLFIVFWFQGALMLLVGLPVWFAVSSSVPLGVWDAVGIVLFVIGFSFEAVGDAQLKAFLRSERSDDAVMDRGLWRYTRHPNYFGNAVLWFGFGALGFAAGPAWVWLGPGVMLFLLLRVSGVALLERSITKRRPAYAAYVARTSAFFPWAPKDEAG